jgi:hypothetical protein
MKDRDDSDGLVIAPGEIYEDCAFHPCLCMGSGNGEVWGISLIDGSQPRSCDLGVCGVRILTPEEAWNIKCHGPADADVRADYPKDRRWWA